MDLRNGLLMDKPFTALISLSQIATAKNWRDISSIGPSALAVKPSSTCMAMVGVKLRLCLWLILSPSSA